MPLRRIVVIEKIFTREGTPGHDVVFAIEARLETPGLAEAEALLIEDGRFTDRAAWLPLEGFRNAKERLLPEPFLANL